MDRKNRILIIIGLIVSFVVVPVITWLILSTISSTSESPQSETVEKSEQDITNAIVQNNAQLSSDGEPTFIISDISIPQTKWYIVTIHTKDDPEGLNSAKILLYDYGADAGGLKVLLGPGTSFPSDITQPLGVPDSIAQELNS